MSEKAVSRLRTLVACLVLAFFWFCMVNLLQDRGGAVGETLARFLPKILSLSSKSGVSEATARKRPSSSELLPDNAPLPPPPPPERLIIVDAGHGGLDGGTQGNGLLEKDWSLQIAKALEEDLVGRGFKVRMTRNGDDTVELSDRIDIANEQANHLLVSVHLNHTAEPSVSGIETFYWLDQSLSVTKAVREQYEAPTGVPLTDSRSELLAQSVQENLIQVTGAHDRGKKEESFFVLRNSNAPAILIECGFVSNPQEAEHIVTSGYRKRLARGIGNGITAFLNEVQADRWYGVTLTPDLPEAPEELVQVPAEDNHNNIQ
ncbi:MAG: N-acetylmuramoyl-L-alanine amidase [Verrucomicrobia bacterium]|nr:N-acetylmuramoyl-L-alanine amidase [Verrucomicrobiota bacterium]